MKFQLTKYGRRELLTVLAIAAVWVALIVWAAARFSPAIWAAIVLPAVLAVWGIAFFRDPEREIPAGQDLFVSPADGRVADITRVGSDSPLGRDGVKIGIFMNVINVHVNRSPCNAVVDKLEHFKGVFLDARHAEASEKNESATIFLTHDRQGTQYPLLVRQVAGLIARRIVTDLHCGQSLQRGERIGMIKFGSRLELWLPMELAGQVCVEIGQVVKAGQTVLATASKEMAGG